MIDEAKRGVAVEAWDAEAVVRVLVPLGLAFRRTVEKVERETGVGARKMFALLMLGEEDGMTQGEMCRRFDLDPSRLTRIGQALETDGLIRRERDPGDNRVVRMYLTAEGREKLRRFSEVGEELRRRIRSVMAEEEQEELRRLLTLFAGAMKDRGEAS